MLAFVLQNKLSKNLCNHGDCNKEIKKNYIFNISCSLVFFFTAGVLFEKKLFLAFTNLRLEINGDELLA